MCCLFAERRNNYKYLLFVGTVTSDWLAARIQSVFRNCISINLSLPLYFSRAISKIGNGESRKGERGTGNGERGISKIGNI